MKRLSPLLLPTDNSTARAAAARTGRSTGVFDYVNPRSYLDSEALDAFMKKPLLEFLWTVFFFILGIVLIAAFIGDILPWSFHDHGVVFVLKGVAAVVVSLICLIGLPYLALILGIRGVLPGTGCGKDLPKP